MIAAALRVPLVLVLGLLFAQCSTAGPDAASDLERTWRAAWVMVPDAGGVERLKMDSREVAGWDEAALLDDATGRPRPIVLYMHGCTGLGSGDRRFLKHLVTAGFVIVAPDSMARRFRPLQCDPKTRTGGHNLFVYDFRQAEINYALQRLDAAPWARGSERFLFGASEGGVAAALYRGGAFKARVITHWTCHGGALVRGLAAPPGEPVLAIVESDDPWYDAERTAGQRGDCGGYFEGRPDARSLVLTNGKRHNVFLSDRARREIIAFLKNGTGYGASDSLEKGP